LAESLKDKFPAPKATGSHGGAAKAIDKGEEACRNKSPREVEEEFLPAADLKPEEAKLASKLPAYEKQADEDPNFVAGQLAALVYERGLAERAQTAGFRGCIYSLARHFEEELSGGN